jgi:hypothetical protein
MIASSFYKASTNAAIRGVDGCGRALAIAQAAMERGELCVVCAHCQTPAQKGWLSRLDNLTHGICESCLEVLERDFCDSGAGEEYD